MVLGNKYLILHTKESNNWSVNKISGRNGKQPEETPSATLLFKSASDRKVLFHYCFWWVRAYPKQAYHPPGSVSNTTSAQKRHHQWHIINITIGNVSNSSSFLFQAPKVVSQRLHLDTCTTSRAASLYTHNHIPETNGNLPFNSFNGGFFLFSSQAPSPSSAIQMIYTFSENEPALLGPIC